MDNNHFPQNAISHKELNSLLKKAKKEITSIETSNNHECIEHQELNDLIKNWTEASQKILLMLQKKEQVLTKNTTPKSLMAFGAMRAHINMALHALQSTEFDQ